MSASLEINFLSHADNGMQVQKLRRDIFKLEAFGVEIVGDDFKWFLSKEGNCPGGLLTWFLCCLDLGESAYKTVPDTGRWRTYFLKSHGGVILATIESGIATED